MGEFKVGGKYRTRDGRPVTLVSTCGSDKYPLVGYVSGEDVPKCWREHGEYFVDEAASELDLVEIKMETRYQFVIRDLEYQGLHTTKLHYPPHNPPPVLTGQARVGYLLDSAKEFEVE